jgi:glycosyltransferase involved in cell wall biosynthesis
MLSGRRGAGEWNAHFPWLGRSSIVRRFPALEDALACVEVMRIGLLASVGGTIDAFFSPWISAWERQGAQVFVAAGTSAQSCTTHLIPGLGRRPGRASPAAVRALAAWVKESHLDVVVTNTATASALVRLAPAGVPVIYFCHGLHWNDVRSPADLTVQTFESLLLRRTAAVMTLNSDDERWFRRRLDPQRVLRLRYGVGLPVDQFPRSSRPVGGDPRFLWVGELGDRKRPTEVVEVARHLRGLHPAATIHLVGTGPLEAVVEKAVRRADLETTVIVRGRQQVAPLMSASSAVLHTATWEGLPRVGLEAAAIGRRFVAYDVKGVRDIPGARLVAELDSRGLAEQLLAAHDEREGDLVAALPDPSVMSSDAAADRALDFIRSFTR